MRLASMGETGRPSLDMATLLWLCAIAAPILAEYTDILMPGPIVTEGETYLCTNLELDDTRDHYLIGFNPHGSMETAHHMLIFGCENPGSKAPVWNCGEMSKKKGGSPCGEGGTQIIYAWAKDAPKLQLPEGVGFKVGGDSLVQNLVLQVHYMHPVEGDHSGVTVESTTTPLEKTAGTLLMVTGGGMQARSKENFETACIIDEPVEMHPFAFRTHTHKHGRKVSGYKVVEDEQGVDEWTLIGKKDPQLPQMFYPVEDSSLTIKEGDMIGARCEMENDGDKPVHVGPTGADEMCNFYLMYWVEGDRTLRDNTCLSPGPPNYYWAKNSGLNHIPK